MATCLPPLCGRREPCDLPFCRRGSLRIIDAITNESVITRILRHCKLASVPPPIAPPVVAKRYSRSTRPMPAWARRRRVRRDGVCRPFAPVKDRLKSSAPSFLKPAVPRPSYRETPETQPYPILRGMSRLRIAVLPLAVSRCCGLPPGAGAAAIAADG
jgi:hypothetical protein